MFIDQSCHYWLFFTCAYTSNTVNVAISHFPIYQKNKRLPLYDSDKCGTCLSIYVSEWLIIPN